MRKLKLGSAVHVVLRQTGPCEIETYLRCAISVHRFPLKHYILNNHEPYSRKHTVTSLKINGLIPKTLSVLVDDGLMLRLFNWKRSMAKTSMQKAKWSRQFSQNHGSPEYNSENFSLPIFWTNKRILFTEVWEITSIATKRAYLPEIQRDKLLGILLQNRRTLVCYHRQVPQEYWRTFGWKHS